MERWSVGVGACFAATFALCSCSYAETAKREDASAKGDPASMLIKKFNWGQITPRGTFMLSNHPSGWASVLPAGMSVPTASLRRRGGGWGLRVNAFEVVVGAGKLQVRVFQGRSFHEGRDKLAAICVLDQAVPRVPVAWEGNNIGEIGVGYGGTSVGKDDHLWMSVCFVRGNVCVDVGQTGIKGEYTDPRPVAAGLDRYMSTIPRLVEPADGRGGSLSLTVLPRAGQDLAEGTDCGLTIDPSAEMTTPQDPGAPFLPVGKDEANAVGYGEAAVPRDGVVEVQIWARGASVRMGEDGKSALRFHAHGKQTVECFYLDKDGKVVRYGKTEVTVQERPAEKPDSSGPPPAKTGEGGTP